MVIKSKYQPAIASGLKKQTILTQKNRITSKNMKQTFFEDVFEARPAAAWIFFSAKKAKSFFETEVAAINVLK